MPARVATLVPTLCPNSRFIVVFLLLSATMACSTLSSAEPSSRPRIKGLRGPVDLVVAPGEEWAVTVNQESGTLSLVDLQNQRVLDEKPIGDRPGSICWLGENQLLASCRYSGELVRFEVAENELCETGRLPIGMEPLGVAAAINRNEPSVTPQFAYVGLQASGEVAEIALADFTISRRFDVGVWPRYLAISKDGERLAVGLSGQSSIAVVNVSDGETLYEEPLSGGINIGHLQINRTGDEVYFPWMIYRSNPITVRDIQRGWVLASRLARIRMDGPQYREAISLDVPRLAVADPFGVSLTPNEQRIAVTSSGTHELLVYRLNDLPFQGAGGPGDLIDPALLRDDDLFYRLPLGGRPMGLRASRDNRQVYITNHLKDCVQIVDLDLRQVVSEIQLAQPEDVREQNRQLFVGMELFYDAGRSLDQWYSCHSCHVDGGSNAKAMDTWNDGTELTSKTVLPLFGVTQTGPWTWHGWQESLKDSLQNSFVSTMKGEEVSQEQIDALHAYLGTLELPPNPFVGLADSNTENGRQFAESVENGKELFHRESVGCSACHSGPNFSDGEIHHVGLERASDAYEGFNTPSLRGVYRKPRLLHDGRAKNLQTVLKKWHRPQDIGGGAELTSEQIDSLVAYLKTL
ncbi:MAG: c-type cytochrome [Pirellulaceae bacterium]